MKLIFLSILHIVILTGCGLSVPNAASTNVTYECASASASLLSCCSGHGGPQVCLPPVGGFYFRTQDGALVCQDSTISLDCFR